MRSLFRRRPNPGALPPVHICAPDYSDVSSGVRCLYLLCGHLNRLGVAAAMLTPADEPALFAAPAAGPVPAPIARRAPLALDRALVVYPEIVAGNPLGAPHVVRYLLNRPGLFTPHGIETYGARDQFFHFAPEFVPDGIASHDLYIPLVDRSVYYRPLGDPPRDGYLLYSSRVPPRIEDVPAWARPLRVLSMRAPLGHRTLATLYRASRGLVTFERTAAIFEALHCGCPVLCLPHPHFAVPPQAARFAGAGLAWGGDEQALRRAAAGIDAFLSRYAALEASLDTRLLMAFDRVRRRLNL